MTRKISVLVGFFSLFLLFSLVSKVFADDIKVKPEISKNNFQALFNNTKQFSKHELMVKFNSAVTEDEKWSILKSVHAKELSSLEKGDIALIAIPETSNLETVAAQLIKNKQIEFVEPNYKVKTTFTPKDPGFKKQWYLNKIQMSKAWDQTKGASYITVAIIDSGIQTNHPELLGKIVNPYNSVTGGTTFSPSQHGTHVAGIIAATINSSGIAGIAPNVKVMPVNVFSGEYANMYDIASGIYYAIDRNADIINLSIGSRSYSYMLDYAVHYARSKGVLVVAAAGNEDTYLETYPAAFDTVLGVSATDSNDRITNFSNYGDYIDFAAPGQTIYSTVSGSSYKEMSGTSMSAPIVSGVAALILSKNPFMSPVQVEDVLKKSSTDLGGKGWDYFYGYGRVDASKALQYTSYPITNIYQYYPNFNMSGTNKNTISISAHSGSYVSLFVQNSKGQTLKTLMNYYKSTGKKLTVTWDGKQNSGVYVPSGTYKILAKVTNGKDTLYKGASVKVIDKVIPSIQLSSSVAYSPALSSKVTIPFQVNKNAIVTATILDRFNKTVKTLLNNSAVSVGKRSVSWDGKNSKGQRVSDGTYKLVMSVVGHNKVKGITRQMTINVDSLKPGGNTALNSTLFKVDGKATSSLKMNLNENIYLNAYITSDKGIKVKKLAAEKWMKAGTSILYWDGRTDQNQFAVEGKYQYLLEFRDAAGNKSTMKSSLFTLQDWQLPVISAQSNMEYRLPVNIPIVYSISKPGNVSVEIMQNGKSIRLIQASASKAKGNHTFNWDGKDSKGNMLSDGKYQFKITTVDKYKLTGIFTGNVTMALKRVEIQYPTVVPFHEWEEVVAEVYFKLSDHANITVEIRDTRNNKVKTIMVNQALNEGIHSFKWDGSDDEGYNTYEDSYIYVIKAINSAGNETSIQGEIKNEDPSWLIAQEYNFIPYPDQSWYNQKLNIEVTTNQPVKAYLNVFTSYYGNPFEMKEFNLVKGQNTITYEKANENNLYYKLVYEDELGNKYTYEIDEYRY
jgi:flagellar hook assembly protein FlgD